MLLERCPSGIGLVRGRGTWAGKLLTACGSCRRTPRLPEAVNFAYEVSAANGFNNSEEEFQKYLEIVSDPMDFGTIGTKLQDGGYKSIAAYAEDLNRVFRAARVQCRAALCLAVVRG